MALQERHVARAFQELTFRTIEPDGRLAALRRVFGSEVHLDPCDLAAVQEAIRSNLMKAGRPAFIPEASISFEDAYRLILELGDPGRRRACPRPRW